MSDISLVFVLSFSFHMPGDSKKKPESKKKELFEGQTINVSFLQSESLYQITCQAQLISQLEVLNVLHVNSAIEYVDCCSCVARKGKHTVIHRTPEKF